MRRRFNPGIWGSYWLSDLQDRFGWEAGLVVSHALTTYHTRSRECIAVIKQTSDQTGLSYDETAAILAALAVAIEGRHVLPFSLRVIATIDELDATQNGRLPREIWQSLRAAIFRRDNYTCQYCGAAGARLECDHVVPVSRGGSNDESNLVTACFTCNRSKRDKTLAEWVRNV
jgi:hypothetical protein